MFFLEKYLIITPSTRDNAYPTSLDGIVSISEFKEELQAYEGNKEIMISEAMGNAEISEDGESYEGSVGIKFGVRLCFCPPSGFSVPNAIEFDRAFKTSAATDHPSSAHYFPMVKFEQDISDRLLSEINLEDSNIGEDLKCYVDNMVLTDEFGLLFNSLLVTRKVPSLMAMYMYDGFIDSIGMSTTEREEGKENRGNGKWKGKILDDTKIVAVLFCIKLARHGLRQRSREQKRKKQEQIFIGEKPSTIRFDKYRQISKMVAAQKSG